MNNASAARFSSAPTDKGVHYAVAFDLIGSRCSTASYKTTKLKRRALITKLKEHGRLVVDQRATVGAAPLPQLEPLSQSPTFRDLRCLASPAGEAKKNARGAYIFVEAAGSMPELCRNYHRAN